MYFTDINTSFGTLLLSLMFLLTGIESYLLKEIRGSYLLNYLASCMFAIIFILDYFNL